MLSYIGIIIAENKLMARQEKLESLQQGSEDMSLLSGNFAKRSSTSCLRAPTSG